VCKSGRGGDQLFRTPSLILRFARAMVLATSSIVSSFYRAIEHGVGLREISSTR
jgi:hypothetical protein